MSFCVRSFKRKSTKKESSDKPSNIKSKKGSFRIKSSKRNLMLPELLHNFKKK